MEINYRSFKEDCRDIIEPYLSQYGYIYDINKSEDYINFYRNDYNYIQVSMLEDFPYIGVSWAFLDKQQKLIAPSLLDRILKINRKDIQTFYEEFKSKYDINDYSVQMLYVVSVLDKFYETIVKGDISIEEI